MLLSRNRNPGISGALKCCALSLVIVFFLAGCASEPLIGKDAKGKTVCDSYIILHMCVQDYVGDGIVDMIYFSDTYEIFMYRVGMKDIVAPAMPFHQCAVPLPADLQEISNRILFREDLSFSEELDIKKDLLFAYLAAKPGIDACNASFEDREEQGDEPEEEFYIDESDWEN